MNKAIDKLTVFVGFYGKIDNYILFTFPSLKITFYNTNFYFLFDLKSNIYS